MRKIGITAAFLAVFFLSACTQIEKADRILGMGEEKAIDLIEFGVETLGRQYDRLVEYHRDQGLRHQARGQKIDRLGLALGRSPKWSNQD